MSTVQIGITTIGLLNGIVGEAALSPPVAQWMTQRGLEEGAARLLATGLVVAGVTYLSIVLGELVPKRVGQINPERMARLVARPMQWLATLSAPFVRLLAGSTRLVLRLLGIRDQGAPRVTAEAIDAVLTEGADAGVIEHQEHRMLKNFSGWISVRSARSWCPAATSSSLTPSCRGKRTWNASPARSTAASPSYAGACPRCWGW